MTVLINLGYLIFIIVASPYYLVRFITTASARQGLGERFGFVPKRDGAKPAIWLHCASVGEVNTAATLIRELVARYPNHQLVLSTITPTGQATVKKKYPEYLSIFAPLDLSWVVKRTLKRIKPALIIIMEQEIWPNFVRVASKKNIPVVLVNARISDRSFNRYRWLNWIFKPTLSRISHLAVQNEDYAERYRSLGVPEEKITVTGNMKYDNLPKSQIPMTNDQLRIEMGIKENELVLVGGSTHHPEEEILINTYQYLLGLLTPNSKLRTLRLILAPRHPERAGEIERLIKAKGFDCLRRSETNSALRKEFIPPKAGYPAIILLDTLGELVKVYALATVVFVGGSLCRRRGGQNILEPAALGKPVLFGPYAYNFQAEAELLIKSGAGLMVKDRDELLQILKDLLANPVRIQAMGRRAQDVVTGQQDATGRTIPLIAVLLNKIIDFNN